MPETSENQKKRVSNLRCNEQIYTSSGLLKAKILKIDIYPVIKGKGWWMKVLQWSK